MVRPIFPILALLVSLMPSLALANTIYWQTYHRPPGVIMLGPETGNGFVQKVLQLIIARMPEFQHEMPMTSVSRAISDIRAQKNVCHPALYKTKQRNQFMYFSDAAIVSPSNRLVARSGILETYAQNNEIDLNAVLNANKHSFSLVKNRSYSQVIDTALANHKAQTHMHLMTHTDLTATFHMINLNRIDFTIVYPFELSYYLSQYPETKAQFKTFNIQGVSPFNYGHIACPKNSWGKTVINKINVILREIKNTPEFKLAATTWWREASNSAEFELYYQQQFMHN